jgi:hypothetical protein
MKILIALPILLLTTGLLSLGSDPVPEDPCRPCFNGFARCGGGDWREAHFHEAPECSTNDPIFQGPHRAPNATDVDFEEPDCSEAHTACTEELASATEFGTPERLYRAFFTMGPQDLSELILSTDQVQLSKNTQSVIVKGCEEGLVLAKRDLTPAEFRRVKDGVAG